MKNLPNNDGHADYRCLLWAAAACVLGLALVLGGLAWGLVELIRWGA